MQTRSDGFLHSARPQAFVNHDYLQMRKDEKKLSNGVKQHASHCCGLERVPERLILMTLRPARKLTTCFLLIGLALTAVGCADRPLLGSAATKAPLAPNETFIQVNKQGSTFCYTRVIEGAPFDQICQKGDYVRYSDNPDPEEVFQPIPEYIMALFGAMSDPVVSSVTSHGENADDQPVE